MQLKMGNVYIVANQKIFPTFLIAKKSKNSLMIFVLPPTRVQSIQSSHYWFLTTSYGETNNLHYNLFREKAVIIACRNRNYLTYFTYFTLLRCRITGEHLSWLRVKFKIFNFTKTLQNSCSNNLILLASNLLLRIGDHTNEL